ncbi:MAG: hypothetical protein C4320_03750 [Armatimonadota bacterium]
MRLNIQTKLAGALLALGLPTVLAMGLLGYLNTQSTIRTLVRQQLGAANASKAAHLRQTMAGIRENVVAVSQDPTIGEALRKFAAASQGQADAENTAKLWDYFRDNYPADDGSPVPEPADTPYARRLQELYIAQNPYPLDRHDELVAPVGDDSPYTRTHRQFHPILKRFRDANGIHNIMLVDATSRRVVYAVLKHADFQAPLEGATLAGSNLKSAIDEALAGRVVFADYQRFAPAFNAPVAYYVAPVGDGDKVIGAIAAQLNPGLLTDLVQGGDVSAVLGKGGDSFVIGEDGLFRSEVRGMKESPDKLFRKLSEAGVSDVKIQRAKREGTAVLNLGLAKESLEIIRQEKTGFGQFPGYDGEPVFATFLPVNIDGVKWTLISRREVADALAPLASLRRGYLLTGLLVLVAFTIAAGLLARTFVQPIRHLGDAARRFGNGETNLQLAERSRDDEFGILARQFDTMVAERDRAEQVQNQIRRNIVHDLKTPVTVIRGMSETLGYPEMAEDPTWREEVLRAIIEQSERLMDDLRDILMPINANYKPELESFDLAQLIERSVRAEKHTTRARDHILTIEGTEEPLIVTADRRKIRRVVENLVSNAIKYSPGNGKHVWIALGRDGDSAVIQVRDEGLGMTQEEMTSVLRQGGRIARHADLGIEGTGFGLDSVQRVLQAHGGTLTGTSEPNRGSTFTATFPIRTSPAETLRHERAELA